MYFNQVGNAFLDSLRRNGPIMSSRFNMPSVDAMMASIPGPRSVQDVIEQSINLIEDDDLM
jgi:hypothetical protein